MPLVSAAGATPVPDPLIMKMLKPELSRSQDLVTRFQNKAIAASRIGQENIVGVTDFGRTDEGRI